MQREMSSHLEASFSTRGNGQLVSEEVVATQAQRVGPMQEVPAPGLNRDGQYSLQTNRVRKASGLSGNDMLPGMGAVDLSLPFFGPVNWKILALGGGVGIIGYLMMTKKSRKVRSAKAAIADAQS